MKRDATRPDARPAPRTNRCVPLCCSLVMDCPSHHFQGEYLRDPSTDEPQGIAAEYEVFGFVVCIGCLDRAGWEWDACPARWHGDYKGAAKKVML